MIMALIESCHWCRDMRLEYTNTAMLHWRWPGEVDNDLCKVDEGELKGVLPLLYWKFERDYATGWYPRIQLMEAWERGTNPAKGPSEDLTLKLEESTDNYNVPWWIMILRTKCLGISVIYVKGWKETDEEQESNSLIIYGEIFPSKRNEKI